jgi:hypothetical protein
MPAVVQNHTLGSERAGSFTGRREWNRIVTSMYDYRGDFDPRQLPDEVEIAETFPDGLLYAADHPEWRQICCVARVGEIAGDSELESALSIRLRIALAEA